MESPWTLLGSPWKARSRFAAENLGEIEFLRLREDFVGLHGDSAETSCRLHDDLMGLHGDSVGLHGDSMVTQGLFSRRFTF